MSRSPRSALVCIVLAAGLWAITAAGADAAGAAAVSFETPAGPVSCTLPSEPGWANVLESATPTTLTAEVVSAGALRCETASYGEIELAGAGFPWILTVNTKSGKAKLKGTKKLVLELTVLSLGAKCVYESGKMTGSLSTEIPPVLSISAPRVKLNSKRSLFLCPAGGSFSASFPLG